MILKTTSLLLSGLLILSFSAHAESVITLKDGSQIKGEMTSLANGVYTLTTPVIGEVRVAVADVVNISSGVAAAPAAAAQAPAANAGNNNLTSQVQAAQAQLMSNPQTVLELQQLLEDPEIAQILADPELVRIVTSNDVNAIANNPKAQALVNNPKMRALMERLRGSAQ